MPTGTVKWFDSKKGFGFIVGPEGKDVFVHFTRIQGDGFRSLRDGEQVEYEHTQGEKGLLATAVRRVGGADGNVADGNVANGNTRMMAGMSHAMAQSGNHIDAQSGNLAQRMM